MSGWYYVVGTERLGPVEEIELHNIFKEGTIQKESYVWTKGFPNWERLHSVSALEYFFAASAEDKPESPEIEFHFDWKSIPVSEDIFYIRIGKDRTVKEKILPDEILGPYTLPELRIALGQKRISEQTFIYTPGMLYWEHLGAVPALQDLWQLGDRVMCALDRQSPGLVVIERQPLPIIALIKSVSKHSIKILCSQHLSVGDMLWTTLYKVENVICKNLALKVISVNKFEQSIECDISHLDDEQKKIIHECSK